MRAHNLTRWLVLGTLTFAALVSSAAEAQPTVVATIRLAPGGHSPRAVAVNPTTNRIYVGTYAHGIVVIDGASNAVIATIDLPGNEIAVNPETDRVYATGPEGVSVRSPGLCLETDIDVDPVDVSGIDIGVHPGSGNSEFQSRCRVIH